MNHVICLLGLFWISFFFPWQFAMAQETYGTMDTFYQTTENKTDEGTETTWNLVQGYYAGFKNSINPKMDYSVDIRTTINETDERKTTTIFPTTQFNVTNDLFDGRFGSQITSRDSSDGPKLSSNSWNLNLNSKLEKIPEFRLQYSRDRNYDDLRVHDIDDKTERIFGSVKYTYDFLDMVYNYNRRDGDDYVQDSVQEGENHLTRVNLRKSFFKNMLMINSEYGWDHTTDTTRFKSDTVLPEERTVHRGLYLNDTTPSRDELNGMRGLIDGDLVTGTGIDIGSTGKDYQNVGVELNSPGECDLIYLYVTPNYDPSLSNSRFTWEVYSSDDGIDWDLITNRARFSYDTLRDRFEIEFPSREDRYFKAVNTDRDERSFVGSVYITEMEILGSEERKAGDDTKNTTSGWDTSSTVTFRPLKRLTMGYNYSYDFTENDPGSLENTEESHGVNLSCELHKYLSSSAQYWTRTDISTERDSKNDSFSLQFSSNPLETLSMSLSFNHTETDEEKSEPGSKEEEKTEGETDSWLFHLTAAIYEGVDFTGDFNYTKSDNATGTESTGKTIDLDLKADLTANTALEIDYNKSWQESEDEEGEDDTDSSDLEITLNYNPSDIFYLRTEFNINETEDGTDTSYGFNASWLPTKKLQLNLDSRFEQDDEDTSSYNIDLSWNVSRYIIFRCGFNYSKTEGEEEDESQSVYTRLSVTY